MRNLVFLAAAGLALAACQNATLKPVAVSPNEGSSQAPSMAPAPQLGGFETPASTLPTNPTSGQAPSMAPVSGPGVSVSAPAGTIDSQAGSTGQSPSMSPSSTGPALKRQSGQNPVVVPQPGQ